MPPLSISTSDVTGLNGKTVVVTGGSRGIGLSIAKFMVAKGAAVFIADVRPPSPEAVSPDSVVFLHCDVTDWKSIISVFDAVIVARNRIDILVANAGIGEVEDLFLDDLDPSSGELLPPKHHVLQVNLIGVMNSVKVALHHMRKQKGGGSIVITASTAGYIAESCLPAYSTSKHGLIGFMRSLRLNAPKLNVRVNCVAPYMTESDLMGDDLRAKLNANGVPLNEPSNVALAVGHLVTSGKNGKTILSAANTFYEIEEDMTRLAPQWMGGIDRFIHATQGAELFVSKSGL